MPYQITALKGRLCQTSKPLLFTMARSELNKENLYYLIINIVILYYYFNLIEQTKIGRRRHFQKKLYLMAK